MPFNPASLIFNERSLLDSIFGIQASNWAILLCKFNDTIASGQPLSFYNNLFTGAGSGTFNMTDFFRDMSHGKLDLTGSKVFGWFTLPYAQSNYAGNVPSAPAGQINRGGLIDAARQAATASGVDLSKFDGVVVAMAGQVDLFGVLGGMAAVCDDLSLQPSLLGQEMGHGYGLDHSRKDGDLDDYQDPWDIMSTAGAYEAPSPAYTKIGPGMNAWNMRSRGWLKEDRVWKGDMGTVTLRPLHRTDLPGYLAAELGPYLVEFRVRQQWDFAIPGPTVMVHRFADNHSYMMASTEGNYDFVAGQSFHAGNVISEKFDMQVKSIDPDGLSAVISLRVTAQPRIPSLVGTLVGGVAQDGPGGIIIGGVFHPIPPRGPESEIVRELIAALAAQNATDPLVGLAARSSAMARIASTAVASLKSSLNLTRSPRPEARQQG